MEIESLISLLLFFLFCFSYRFYQYARCENIFKKTKWISEKSTSLQYDGCYSMENLTYYINTNDDIYYAMYRIKGLKIEKSPLTIPEEYQIDFTYEQERLYVSEILEAYRRNITDTFLKENRSSLSQKNKTIYKLRDIDYFMFTLLCYLKNCVDYDSYIFKNKVYKERESEDGPYFSCQLTDFGRVCYKILLVTKMYCENNDFTKPLILQSESEDIMSYLKLNTVRFWSYRP